MIPSEIKMMRVFMTLLSLLCLKSNAQTLGPHLTGQALVDHVNDAKTSWAAKYIPISDEEMKFKVMDARFGNQEVEESKFSKLFKVQDFIAPESLSSLPSTFDARQHWDYCRSIKLIRDQAYCGSCWAFGAAEVISDRICIQSNGTQQPIISPEDILSCCGSSCGYGCQGGFTLSAMKFWRDSGVVTGGDFQGEGCSPYSFGACRDCQKSTTTPICQTTCQAKYKEKEYGEDKYYGSSAYRLSSSSPSKVQHEIMTNGPVEASFQVYEDFYYYQSGVYHYVSGRQTGTHAVKIIGWGTENGMDFWLAANSWGTSFGENGFFKIRRGHNECGIENYVVAGMAKSGSAIFGFCWFLLTLTGFHMLQ